MNINRASMADSGYSPPTRIFEVAGAGGCLLCDDWQGIEDCFTPGEEILVVRSAEDVVSAIRKYNDLARKKVGAACRQRALQDHTYALRAEQAEAAFLECVSRRQAKVTTERTAQPA